MSAQRDHLQRYFWVPDDTEESVLGADWHQESIVQIWTGLEDVTIRHGLTWHVGNQLPFHAWHPDRSPWNPEPDIMVHPQFGDQRFASMDATIHGIPTLVIEVLSPSTWKTDVGTDPTKREGAKAYEYIELGVAEYLIFDPEGAYVPEQVRGWRLEDSAKTEWSPEPDGRHHSALGVAFQPDGVYLRIFDPAGQPVPYSHEKTRENAILRQETAALHAELERLRRQADQQR